MIKTEFGSDFEYTTNEDFLLKDSSNSYFNSSKFSLFFSGRVALYNLLNYGIKKYNWTQVYLPSFYCHEVVNYIKPLNILVTYYDFNPFVDAVSKKIECNDSDSTVIINVSFFGLIKLDLSSYKKCIIIDDVTHDVASIKQSKAHYCFGSLRKELPVPVGGFCYSPKDFILPTEKPSNHSECVAVQKLTAMYLKSLYLKNTINEKDLYRNLYGIAEEEFEHHTTNVGMPDAAKSILFQLDFEKIISQKKYNLQKVFSILGSVGQVFKINNLGFGLVLLCNSEAEKQKLNKNLVENSIFPATLWPKQFDAINIEYENRMLFVHVDFRYSTVEVEHIAVTIKSLL